MDVQSGVTISNNSATGAAGSGGGIFNNAGSMTINGASLSGNSSVRAGGAIEDLDGSGITITGSLLDGNSTGGSPGNGGAVHLTGSGSLDIALSTVSNNSAAAEGGGLWNSAASSTSIVDSEINTNSAPDGAGLFNDGDGGSMMLENSTVANNSASGNGGGLTSEGGTATVTNSTFSGNSATGSGGGVQAEGGTVDFNSATIAFNNADGTDSGGGVNNAAATVTALNTIFSDNTSPTGPDFAGTLTSEGFNLISDDSGTTVTGDTTGNVVGESAELQPLADNGGNTRTHFPAASSPVLDQGNSSQATDQRGVVRPINLADADSDGSGNATDIGSVEAETGGVAPPPGMGEVIPVPTLSEYAMILMLLLMLGFGGLAVYRRQKVRLAA